MSRKQNVWVSPMGDGRWKVQREGAQRASKVTDRKAHAEQVGRGLAQQDGVNIIIQDRHGRIQQHDSYGNDPFPPRDIEH